MTLYLIQNGAAIPWTGEPLNGGIRYPTSIEQSWPDADLAALGLHRAQPADPVPAGQVVTGTSVELVDGVPKLLNSTRAILATDVALQRYQFLAMLQIGQTGQGTKLADLVAPAIASIADPVARAVAQAKFDSTQTFERNDTLVVGLAAAAGLSSDQVDAYWLEAAAL